MRKTGNLFIVSGPSGAGKGTIIQKTLKDRKNINLSISFTTRPPRDWEIDGKNYFFCSKDKFEEMIKNDEFLEYAVVYNYYYGTPKKPVIDALKKGEDILLEVDIQGALKIKKSYKKGIFIFVLPPSMKELKNRITDRGSETDEELNLRCISAFEEISYIQKYDYYIINDKIEKSISSFKAIMDAEKCRVMADIKDIINTYREELK